MSNEIIKSYNLDSFTLTTEKDENGNIQLVAENKAKNFRIIWGADQLMASVVPGAIDTASKEEMPQVLAYTETLLNVIYAVANMPLPGDAYDEMFNIFSKHIKIGELPNDISQDELEQDLALAHAAEDVSTEEKAEKLAQQVEQELKDNTKQ